MQLQPLWPHQRYGIDAVIAAHEAGVRRIVLTSPTGGGKGKMMQGILDHFLARGEKAVLYCNRRLLLTQITNDLRAKGYEFGVRAAGHRDERHLPFQVSSLPTEVRRVTKRQDDGDWRAWEVHDARVVIIDEGHLYANESAQRIIRRHVESGATLVYVTATPLGLGEVADHLVVAGTNSELRKCGALVPCVHFSPDEPDLRHVGRVPLGQDLTEKQNEKAVMAPGLFGRVYDNWRRLNPDARPTILFGPSVAGSIFLCQEFWRKGVSCAHVGCDGVWWNGKEYDQSESLRRDLLEGSRDGSVRVLANRFVLREGVDCPWLYHGILACVFGSLTSYLQAGGRILRAHPSLSSVVIQDHGGAFWRHGSLNADRHWELDYTNEICAGLRTRELTENPEKQPVRCRACGRPNVGRRYCVCGERLFGMDSGRVVVQTDGVLRDVAGFGFVAKRTERRPDSAKLWEKVYWSHRKSGRTFPQAESYFRHLHGYWPDPGLPLMPVEAIDGYRKVADVPFERLVPKPERSLE